MAFIADFEHKTGIPLETRLYRKNDVRHFTI